LFLNAKSENFNHSGECLAGGGGATGEFAPAAIF